MLICLPLFKTIFKRGKRAHPATGGSFLAFIIRLYILLLKRKDWKQREEG